jgi:hypothetical protein
MLRGFDVSGIEFESASQRVAGARLIAAQAGFGRRLNQRRYGVAAGNIGCQAEIYIFGVELGGLFIRVQRIFKMFVHEELAGGEIELGRAAPIAFARLFGWTGRRLGRWRILGRGLSLREDWSESEKCRYACLTRP